MISTQAITRESSDTHPWWLDISRILEKLYGTNAEELYGKLRELSSSFQASSGLHPSSSLSPHIQYSSNDIALITYADSLLPESDGATPLGELSSFFERERLGDVFSLTHLLPFYPWDTDRGFSVKDYYAVAEGNGSWEDIAALSDQTKLMFDFVTNHASIDNPFVQNALIERHLVHDDPRYSDYSPYKDFVICFVEEELPDEETIAKLARPRAHSAFTHYVVYEGKDGKLTASLGTIAEYQASILTLLGTGYVWTTFSRGLNTDGREDTRQVDLNFANPNVLLESLKVLLFYVAQGSHYIRLDAAGYIWKKLGSRSLHEPEVFDILAVFWKFMALTAPGVTTIAEVNEPQDSAFLYLGSGDEWCSDVVYQFTHFPLAIHALFTKDASHYAKWVSSTAQAKGRQFITVLGTHDGMGLKPLHGILPPEDIERLSSFLVESREIFPNYAKLPGGKEIIYEMCATPWEIINDKKSDIPFEMQLARYLLITAMGLSLRGLPAIYINGLLGVGNYSPPEGIDENRTVNRERFTPQRIADHLKTGTHGRKIFDAVSHLLRVRRGEDAFDPTGPDVEVLPSEEVSLLQLMIPSSVEKETILAFYNLSDEPTSATLSKALFPKARNVL
ncbi:MAG: hypothetical protein KDD55_09020, partial [Bdellovibrionales bacterium]|nr:hypothetical protein [Bdellovibrionales bacterium]